ncbi:MAG: cobalt ECF transporter T component CbiQ [Desulfotomaculales bacterium]
MSGLDLDFWAYHNRLAGVHPGMKVIFSLLMLGIGLSGAGPRVLLLLLGLMAALSLEAGIPARVYFRLLAWPLGFLLAGLLALVLESGPGVTWGVCVAGTRVGVAATGLVRAIEAGLRSLAAVSCLYFLILTTPLPAVLGVLRRMAVPMLVLEMAALTYRYLFLLGRLTRGIYTSQVARGGYGSARGALQSLGLLAGQVWLIAHRRAQVLHTALLARGYRDTLLVPPQEYRLSGAVALRFAGLAVLLVLLRVFGG